MIYSISTRSNSVPNVQHWSFEQVEAIQTASWLVTKLSSTFVHLHPFHSLLPFFIDSASGAWANDILACKLSSSPTAVQAYPIKMSAGRRIIIVVVVLVMSFFDGFIALALLRTHSMQAGVLLPLPGRAGHRPELVADRLLPVFSRQVKQWS